MFRNGTRFKTEHQQLTVIDTPIKTDAEGRYCLNDLHKAAGGEKRHYPNYWLTTDHAQGLLSAFSNTGIPAIKTKPGRYGGTYVVEDLVYAYAMWISPEFNLKVIRAYKTLQTQGIAVADHAAEAKAISGVSPVSQNAPRFEMTQAAGQKRKSAEIDQTVIQNGPRSEMKQATLGNLPVNPKVQPPLGEHGVGHFVLVLSNFALVSFLLKVLFQLSDGLVGHYLIDVGRRFAVTQVHMSAADLVAEGQRQGTRLRATGWTLCPLVILVSKVRENPQMRM